MVNKKRKNKPRSIIDIRSKKELMIALLMGGGVIVVSMVSPALLAAAIPMSIVIKDNDKKSKKKLRDSFNALRRDGLIQVHVNKKNTSIILTEKGKYSATKHHLNSSISKPCGLQKWDKKWRILIFDIPSDKRVVRDALRHLIKKLGMHQLQKSVWIYPYNCSEQVNFLKNFLELNDNELRLIVSSNIGEDRKIRKDFHI